MTFLTRFALKNASAIIILCILIIIGGTYSGMKLKKEEMPDMTFPIVAVVTVYPGATPNDVQDKITKPLENMVNNVEGIKHVNSVSSENVSAIIVQFDFSENMDEAQRKVETALKDASLPDGAIAPKISRFNFNSMPMLRVSISNDEISAQELEQKVRDEILPGLSGINGVAQAELVSDFQKAVYVKLSPEKLKENNLTYQQVVQLLQANNVAFPSGSISLNNTVEPIRVAGKFNSLEELENMQIPIAPSTQETLKSAFTQVGNGMVSLGVGMAGMNQALNGQIQLLTLIQQTQSQLFAAKIALQDAEQKSDVVEISKQTQEIMINEATIKALQEKLNTIQATVTQSQNSQSNNTSFTGSSNISLKQVALGDIAEITVGTGESSSFSRMDGNPGVLLQVYKTQEGNTVDVSDAVKEKLDESKNKLPEGTQITVVEDGADPVKESINGMLREGLVGALFAFLVILLFLRNIRSTLIAVISIPLSILVTLAFLKQFNITLNILTLGGLSVATGRIVDDSIVVIENIYRRIHTDNVRNVELIKESAKEVTSAITSSTLTTVAVFLPIGFINGFAAIMFKSFATTVAIALLSSLLVAVTVIPIMSKILLLNTNKVKPKEGKEGSLIKKYCNLLSWALDHKTLTLITATIIFAGSLALIPKVGTSFLPETNIKKLNITINYPAGTDINVINKKAEEIEKILAADEDVLQYQTTIASSYNSSNPTAAIMSRNPNSITVKLKEESDVDSVIEELNNKIAPILDQATINVQQAQNNYGGGGESINSLQVMVIGDNIEKIKQGAELLTQEFLTVQGLDNVTNNLTESKPQIAVNVDQKKASSNALSAAQVGMSIQELLNDKAVSTMQIDNKMMDIKMGLKLDNVNKVNDISSISIQAPLGSVQLSDIAEVKEAPGPVTITSLDGSEYASVSATITEKNFGAVSERVQNKIESITLPDGVRTEMEGVTRMMDDTFTQMGTAMLVAVFAVFLVMMIGLGGATAPLAILFSLPLAAIGSLIALYITGLVLDAPAMIGALMLIGIVVTNAIVLIDRVQQRRREGNTIRDSLMDAGKVRMRPILMTAIATIAALLPLALGLSKGTLISQSLAVVVIGGLTTSTILTLIIVPVVYEILETIKIRFIGHDETSDIAG